MADRTIEAPSLTSLPAGTIQTPELGLNGDSTGTSGHVNRSDQPRNCFRFHGEKEIKKKTGVKARQRLVKDVEGEMLLPSHKTLSVWNPEAPSPATHENYLTSPPNRKSAPRAMSVSNHRDSNNNDPKRDRDPKTGSSIPTDAADGRTAWRWIRTARSSERISGGRQTSPSPVRRRTLSKQWQVVVLITHDETTIIHRPPTATPDLSRTPGSLVPGTDSVPVVAAGIQIPSGPMESNSAEVKSGLISNHPTTSSASSTLLPSLAGHKSSGGVENGFKRLDFNDVAASNCNDSIIQEHISISNQDAVINSQIKDTTSSPTDFNSKRPDGRGVDQKGKHDSFDKLDRPAAEHHDTDVLTKPEISGNHVRVEVMTDARNADEFASGDLESHQDKSGHSTSDVSPSHVPHALSRCVDEEQQKLDQSGHGRKKSVEAGSEDPDSGDTALQEASTSGTDLPPTSASPDRHDAAADGLQVRQRHGAATTGSDVNTPEVVPRRRQFDVVAEKVFVQSLATSIGTVIFLLLAAFILHIFNVIIGRQLSS